MRETIGWTAECCVCGACGPVRGDVLSAARAASRRGWEFVLDLWRCATCVERGRLPGDHVRVGRQADADLDPERN